MRKIFFALLILILNFNFASAEELNLNNLSIQDCLNIALANHPTLRNAKGGTRAAAAQLEQVKANNRATLSASGSLSYNGNYEEWSDRYHSQSAGVTASKLLFDNNKNKLQQEIQKLNLTNSRENEREKRVSIAAAAKRAYYDLVLKILNRDVELEKLKNLEEHVERAKGYYEVGNSAYIDVTKAEADAASARTSLLKAENDILLSQESLLVAMGINNVNINNSLNKSNRNVLPSYEDIINNKNINNKIINNINNNISNINNDYDLPSYEEVHMKKYNGKNNNVIINTPINNNKNEENELPSYEEVHKKVKNEKLVKYVNPDGIEVIVYNESYDMKFGQKECLICIGEFAFGEKLSVLECKHCYHEACLKDWINKIKGVFCPLCQASRT